MNREFIPWDFSEPLAIRHIDGKPRFVSADDNGVLLIVDGKLKVEPTSMLLFYSPEHDAYHGQPVDIEEMFR